MCNDENSRKYMRRAIELALKGAGYTGPNPLVGAVIVKDGRIIGEGYHERYGELHAERNALAHCTEDPKGSSIYVTLEPCCHHGKQPPCTDALIEAGISEVFVGSPDPNPLVAGKGISILRNAGIRVVTDLLRDECDSINKVFFHYITTGLPYVTVKYAMTLDGKIASVTGKSKWISCEESRRHVHKMRAEHMAILAGIGTVLADDPMLNVRDAEGLDPVRVICDTDLRTPLSAKVVTGAADGGNYRSWLPHTIIATSVTDPERLKPYQDRGVFILSVSRGDDGRLSMQDLMKELGSMKIDSILVEGGASINWSVLASGMATHAVCFIAPMIMGGEGAKSPVAGTGCDSPDTAFRLENMSFRMIGQDIAAEGDLKEGYSRCSQE
ncbi:MAG: bifunctional diaminohydroxyphosphoribosylaminopyrimidine deaminase/5-amino-6-(5-phosphoribosylamino)uracil reductase RibD [Eubacterium sp.]|nr:bifunctional diaminohydroxyphosphoribosylaminopyrimidine deaminase/5-amino-6-(5-phosphoribosylamino)uracil reductase RibD [Eubacterium sp.]